MNRRAFTLIEIITTVSIVTVLAALLLPAVGKMTDKSKEAACLGHGRQLGLALANYAAENNGDINGLGAMSEEVGANWMIRMRPYFNAEINGYGDIRLKYMCPSHPDFVKNNAAHVGWAFNTLLEPKTGPSGEKTLHRFTEIFQPARTIYAVDGYRQFDWDAGDGQNAGYTVPKTKKTNYPAGERVFFPHNKKTVAIFLDGHTELLGAPIARDLWAIEK